MTQKDAGNLIVNLEELGINEKKLKQLFSNENLQNLDLLTIEKLQALKNIFMRLNKWSLTADESWNWFCNYKIAALGMTSSEAFLANYHKELESYISIIEFGGYA
jgi:hypothetical protein